MSLPGLQTLRKKPYRTISPTRPELSQEGHTIFITGRNSGIGFSIAHAFVAARAKRVIIVSRRHDSVQAAATRLAKEAEDKGSPTMVEGRVCDVADLDSTTSLWRDLKVDGGYVDTLVLNVASLVWKDFNTNVRASLDFQLAFEVKPDEMQISVSHPGIIFTEVAVTVGMDDSTYPWDDENLPGHYVVWSASREAEFVHGRFVWAAWDVEELKDLVKDGVKKNPRFLMASIEGLSASTNGTSRTHEAVL
ncbi:hypothetical protein LCI18_000736 [Fusarium solani-melongenae]|uniref:Uncharacterized protein n=1 Tax=Fusarium solani subsp. cucurbitae TaxID=2747967 RepID=A0ACD3YLI8_FUSSC|nr:hypothetical protein LCI18_000736 [Fusarium solani-melongenae]